MHTIVLTANDVVDNGLNNTLVYNFPSPKATEGTEVCLLNLYMYYSWPNINATTLANNTYQFTMPPLTVDGAGNALATSVPSTTYTVTLPEGLYEISDINKYMQHICIQNNLYLIDTDTGNYVYFLNMEINPSLYKIQFASFALPPKMPATGYAQPAAGFAGVIGGAFPGVDGMSPGFKFDDMFTRIVGFKEQTSLPDDANNYYTDAGVFPVGVKDSVSAIAPQVQPNSVIHLNCSLVTNTYANPQTFLYPLTAGNASFGGLIAIEPPSYNWSKVQPGTQNSVTLTLTDVNSQPLKILDPNITIALLFKDVEEKLHNSAPESVENKPSSSNMLKAMLHPSNNASSSRNVAGMGLYRR